tara:strand:+ start:125144 stop:125569 length:426 start_codon:yes stop_codon:yes gene_type:complete
LFLYTQYVKIQQSIKGESMNINLDIIARKIKKRAAELTKDVSEITENLLLKDIGKKSELLKEAEKKEIENKITNFEREDALSSSIAERLKSSYFQTDLKEDLLVKTNEISETTNKYVDMIKKNNEETIEELERSTEREYKF